MEINLFDSLFDHSKYEEGYYTCSFGRKPLEGTWVKNNMVWSGVTVFTDSHFNKPIVDDVKSKYKICWLLESKSITPNAYSEIIKYENKFDFILTHDEELLMRNNKYIKSIVGASRVPDNEWGVKEKTRLLSMIASNKNISYGHRYRHEIANSLSSKHNIDMWGSGYKSFNSKLDPLNDYCYTICVMNTNVNNYFTEILIDPISLGCVPILWGCPNINEYFNINGIISFNTIEELNNILHNISFDDYNSRIDAIKENINIAKKMKSTDDLIFNTIKKIIN
jgi:hypothetical protein